MACYEEITYHNNSPDTLRFLYFHLWPNAYKDKSTPLAKQLYRSGDRDFHEARNEERGYIDSLDFKINGRNIKWHISDESCDICILILNEPLYPGSSAVITTPFRVKIPGKPFSRLGHYGQSYQITQWYPKPAVYDNSGWHQMPYLNQGEFYSEFGKFEVFITLPENYSVAATGILLTERENIRIDSIAGITQSTGYFNKADTCFPASSKKIKTLHYVQDSIHDFAWFADKRFHILKSKVTLPGSNKDVTTMVFFTSYEGNLWKKGTDYVNDALYFYSKHVGEYPWPACTAVETALGAGGGMEYPMITNIGQAVTAGALEEVIVHEVGHNWFYGILASNERDFPWLDEGINTFYEQRYIQEKGSNKGYFYGMDVLLKIFGKEIKSPYDVNRLTYEYVMRNGSGQPLLLSSEQYIYENYAIVPYFKGSNSINYLKHYLGTDTFDKCMKEYFNHWKFKHPGPDSFRKVLEQSSGKDLSWFFDDLCEKDFSSDYKIKKVRYSVTDSIYTITFRNRGNLAAPLIFSTIATDSVSHAHKADGFRNNNTYSLYGKNIRKIVIDPENVMIEKKRSNNFYKVNGPFRNIESLEFRFSGIFENPAKTQLFYFPVAGWNKSDGVMPGILLYNPFIPERPVHYRIMPLYSTASQQLSGTFFSEYNLYPGFLNLQKIVIYTMFSRFHNVAYSESDFVDKSEAGIRLVFRRSARFPLRRLCFTAKATNISALKNNLFSTATISYRDYNKKHPVSAMLNTETGTDFMKIWSESVFRVNYRGRRTGFTARFFGGLFAYNKSNNPSYNYRLSGTRGYNDYLYSEIFFDRSGRSSDLWSRQFNSNDCGFGVYTPAQSNSWMTALNLDLAFPVPAPLSVYFNIATFKGANSLLDISTKFPWEAGIAFKVIRDIFVIYFPVDMSPDLKYMNNLYTATYTDKIRFTLRLSKLNPFVYTNDLPLLF